MTISSSLSNTLKILMARKGYRSLNTLAKATHIPQPTLHQLMSGATTQPRAKTLTTLAQHFEITENELLGKDPLPPFFPDTLNLPILPILKWENLFDWPHNKNKIECKKLLLEYPVSPLSFAIHMQGSSMEPLIPEGSLLIFDPEKSLKDKDCVLVYLQTYQQFFVKRMLVEGPCTYLKTFNPALNDMPTLTLNQQDRILAGLIEARISF